MPSPALTAWSTSSAAALSQLQAHRAGGARALQLHYAYVLLLCAHFQAYCRGLHMDATQLLVEASDPATTAVLATNLSFGRQLHRSDLHPHAVTLAACNTWHSALNGLADCFDRVLATHLATLLGSRPW